MKKEFLKEIIDIVTMERIPPELVFKLGQYGYQFSPMLFMDYGTQRIKCVEIKGMNDKQQITCVFCVSMLSHFLPVQVIYSEKTDKCHPHFSFPEEWLIFHSQTTGQTKVLWLIT